MAFKEARLDVLTQAQNQPNLRFLWIGTAPVISSENIESRSLENALNESDHFDVAILDCTLGKITATSRHILARVRDVIANKVVVFYQDDALSIQDFIDLGFIQLSQEEAIFGFNLYDYRKTPDWLNSENWANPERFDKERW